MEALHRIMIQRLHRLGLSEQSIPGFLRDVRNIRKNLHSVRMSELNERIRWLGWGDISLDDHTYQLIVANDQRANR